MAPTQRLTVIDPAVIAHVFEHPARGKRWSLSELAMTLDVSKATLGHIRSGERRQVDAELAHRIAEAVGCHVAVLFMTGVSTNLDNRQVPA